MSEPSREDILEFMDDAERVYWESGAGTTEERDQFWKSLEEQWRSIPDPTEEQLKPPFMYQGDWDTCQQAPAKVREGILNSHGRRWKKLRRQPKTDPVSTVENVPAEEQAPKRKGMDVRDLERLFEGQESTRDPNDISKLAEQIKGPSIEDSLKSVLDALPPQESVTDTLKRLSKSIETPKRSLKDIAEDAKPKYQSLADREIPEFRIASFSQPQPDTPPADEFSGVFGDIEPSQISDAKPGEFGHIEPLDQAEGSKFDASKLSREVRHEAKISLRQRAMRYASEHLSAGVSYCASHLWSWPWVGAAALTLIGIGANALFGGDYLIARVLIYAAIGLVAVRVASEVRSHEKRLGVIVVVIFVGGILVMGCEFLIKAVQGRHNVQSAPQVQPAPSPVAKEAASPTPAPLTAETVKSTEERIPLDIAPEKLLDFFENYNEAQAESLAQPYLGKWLELSGRVTEVSRELVPLRDYKQGVKYGIKVTLATSRKGKPKSWVITYALFEDQRWMDRALVLKRNEDIRVRGKIKFIYSFGFFLEYAEIIE